MDSPEVIITSSKTKPNTYFIFRENGVEVELTLGDHLIASHTLFESEIDYIHKYITKTPLPKKR